MKTTLELPDDLMRRVKLKAVQEDRKLKDLVADLLERGLAADEGVQRRANVPLFQTAPATPESDFSPERIAAILLEQELDAVTKP